MVVRGETEGRLGSGLGRFFFLTGGSGVKGSSFRFTSVLGFDNFYVCVCL